jgi:mannan endo-1,4-beta-mannosidase
MKRNLVFAPGFALLFSGSLLTAGCSDGTGAAIPSDAGKEDGSVGTGGRIGTGGSAATGGSIAGSGSTAGSGNTGGNSASTGGSAGSGGASATGGMVGSGGASATGGMVGSGGASATGGAVGSGGASATGGAVGSGGSAGAAGTGGRVGTGGSQNDGGVLGGTSATGGGTGTGGSQNGGSGAGGASVTGGSTGTGGSRNGGSGGGASGGASGAGGTSHSGGSSGTGGSTGATSTHMYTQGSDLYTYCGEKVLLRGMNQMSIWTDASGSSYPAIASFGSNAVRIVFAESGNATGLDTLLTKAEANKMIPIPEIHDATGTIGGVPGTVTWWAQASVVAVIKKHEKWMLLNIANESGDNNVSDSTFQSTYTSAITSIRNAGIVVPLVIDGSGWGQKVEQLLTVAPALLAADPQKNVIFSWHEYTGGTQENARITTSLEKSKTLGIVLINGEFASGGAGVCTQTIPYKFLLSEAQRVGTGWLAWSWDTNNSDCSVGGASIFNMTTNLTSASGLVAGWASDVVRDDPNSIKNTSVRHCDWK